MRARILKTEADYEAALAYVATLMDAAPGSPEEEQLDLFAMLVEQYEKEHYPIDTPDPVDAILFRMEQQGLTRADLAIYIGSQSKVSEVLNRRRPLSLAMIRKLHEGLGIPADILLQEPGRQLEPVRYNPNDYPLGEMQKRGYFAGWSGNLRETKQHAEELLTQLFDVFGGLDPEPIYCRRTDSELDVHALLAWQARVLHLVKEKTLSRFVPDALNETFFRQVARTSYFPHGPALVQALLNQYGIHFVLLPHLPHTYLDGACFFSPHDQPVVALTLRHDRLDNFWFTLAHELAHLHLHLPNDELVFFDDVEHATLATDDPREAEANAFARDLFFPRGLWEARRQSLLSYCLEEEILALASELEIAPAIVAGRIRWESGDYKHCPHLIGQGEVRKFFPDFGKN